MITILKKRISVPFWYPSADMSVGGVKDRQLPPDVTGLPHALTPF